MVGKKVRFEFVEVNFIFENIFFLFNFNFVIFGVQIFFMLDKGEWKLDGNIIRLILLLIDQVSEFDKFFFFLLFLKKKKKRKKCFLVWELLSY